MYQEAELKTKFINLQAKATKNATRNVTKNATAPAETKKVKSQK